ncbi:MAG: polysaccharide pyruvyl transferase family protein [Desulfurococcaceae archaeon]
MNTRLLRLCNVGDEAILATVIKELKDKHLVPVVLSLNPERTAQLHNVDSCCEKMLSLRFWRNFLESRMLIFAGGGRYGKATIRRMCMLALLAKALVKRVEFRAIGVYPYEWSGLPVITNSPKPFNDLLTRVLIRVAFGLADKVSVRDRFSRRVLSLSGVTRETGLEEDLAFKLSPSDLETSLSILAEHGVNIQHKPLVGVNLRTLHPSVRGNIVKVMASFLDWLIESHNAEVLFVPFGYGSIRGRFFDDDLIVAKELKRSMKQPSKLKVLEEERRPQEILGIFRFFDLFVGMRFHSIIFSTMMRVPTIAIIYDTKTVELLKGKEISCCFSITINELTTDVLKDAARNLLSHGRLC